MKKAINFIFFGAITILFTKPVLAWVVFDPSNYVQNLTSALTTVRQETQMLRDYLNQVEQLRSQVQAAKNLGRDVIAGEVSRIVGDMTKVKSL
ncbi:MAG: hypothetical protein ING36_02045, partial [Burkholderiales bacterium]|nr:hypothetical protein [Burkholderiales bacterium]